MSTSVFSFAIRRTAAIIVTGTVVVASGTYALAATASDPGDGDESTAEPAVEECPADTETSAPGTDLLGPDVLEDLPDLLPTDDDCDLENEEEEEEADQDASEESDDPAPDPADAESDDDTDAADDDDDAGSGSDAERIGGYRNHGQAVSEAARETCPKGPGHGACVSAVAHSDLGKKTHKTDHDEADLDEADDGSDAERPAEKPKAHKNKAGKNKSSDTGDDENEG